MTLNKVLVFLSLSASIITTNAATNFGSNLSTTPNTTVSAPTISSYYGANGKYIGTSQNVNGSTSYYKNGQYQGQTSAGSNIYYNQAGQMQIINSAPPSLNPK
jgi:hypothetical protein